MPIYEYSCKKCGKTIEVIQKFSDKPLKKHQGCGGTLTKLISQSAFQLKGTGWYVTDYAGKSSQKDGAAAEPASAEKKDSSEAKDLTPKDTSAKESKDKKPAKKK